MRQENNTDSSASRDIGVCYVTFRIAMAGPQLQPVLINYETLGDTIANDDTSCDLPFTKGLIGLRVSQRYKS